MSSLIIVYEMKTAEDAKERRVRAQELVCVINDALLEQYKAAKSPADGLIGRGGYDGTATKEDSADDSIPD